MKDGMRREAAVFEGSSISFTKSDQFSVKIEITTTRCICDGFNSYKSDTYGLRFKKAIAMKLREQLHK